MNVSDDLSKWSMAFEDASYANSVLGKLTTVCAPLLTVGEGDVVTMGSRTAPGSVHL